MQRVRFEHFVEIQTHSKCDEMFKLESHWTEENVVNRETVSNMIKIQIKNKVVDLQSLKYQF